jgi:hypothetical protein
MLISLYIVPYTVGWFMETHLLCCVHLPSHSFHQLRHRGRQIMISKGSVFDDWFFSLPPIGGGGGYLVDFLPSKVVGNEKQGGS